MSTLAICIHEDERAALDRAAEKMGFLRKKDCEVHADITALPTLLARVLLEKSAEGIRRYRLPSGDNK